RDLSDTIDFSLADVEMVHAIANTPSPYRSPAQDHATRGDAASPAPSEIDSPAGSTLPSVLSEQLRAFIDNPLPFQPRAPSHEQPAPVGVRPGLASAFPSLTLEQYAQLCVELWEEPHRAGETCARYGIADDRTASALHSFWQACFQRDTEIHKRWVEIVT